MKDHPKDFDIAGFGQAFERDIVGNGNGSGEMGMDNDAVKVANDKQGRIDEMLLSGGPFLPFHLAPLLDELRKNHVENASYRARVRTQCCFTCRTTAAIR